MRTLQYLRILRIPVLFFIVLLMPKSYLYADGDLDQSFGNQGLVIQNFQTNSSDLLSDLLTLPDNKILAAGCSVLSQTEVSLVLARYLPDGSLDESFGTNGFILSTFEPHHLSCTGRKLITQADGKILIVGSSYDSADDYDFAVIRFSIDGELDTSFGEGGLALIDFGNTYGTISDNAFSAALQSNGEIIVVGELDLPSSNPNDDYDRKVGAVRLNTDGTLDTSFGENGYFVSEFDFSLAAFDVTVLPNDKIMLAIREGFPPNTTAGLMRLNQNGILDPSFGETGYVLVDIGLTAGLPKMISYPGDRIILVWNGPACAYSSAFALVMFKSDGSLDPNFGEEGVVITNFYIHACASDAVVREDGKLIVAGEIETFFAVARYNIDGTLDYTFGDSGVTKTDIGPFSDAATAVDLQNDEKIIIGGFNANATGGYNFVLGRYTNCLYTVTILPELLPAGTVGQPYYAILTVSGGVPPYTILVDGTLPEGLQFDANILEISGTPTEFGSSTFLIKAIDANGCSGTRFYSIDIFCPSITVLPEALPDGQLGIPYYQNISASGGNWPYSFFLFGSLPDGLMFDPSQWYTISGTPLTIGTYNFIIEAVDVDNCARTKNYSITINPPADFSITCDPNPVSIQQGLSGTSTCTITSINNFDQAVSLSATYLPADVTPSFDPNPVTPPPNSNINSTLTLNVSSDVNPGSYPFTVIATNDNIVHTFDMILKVTAAPPPADFQLHCNPDSLTIEPGGSDTSTCTVTSVNGFNSAVNLSCLSLPADMTCSFNPPQVIPPSNGSADSILTVIVGANVPRGSYNFSVEGSDGLLTHTTQMVINVEPFYVEDFEDGVADGFTFLKGTWTVINGALTGTYNRKANALAPFTMLSNHALEADISTIGGAGSRTSLLAWYVDKKTLVEVLMKEAEDRWVVKFRLNGAIVAKTKAIQTIQPNTNYRLKLKYDGDAYHLSIDGIEIILLSAPAPQSGIPGFRVKGTTSIFDELMVY